MRWNAGALASPTRVHTRARRHGWLPTLRVDNRTIGVGRVPSRLEPAYDSTPRSLSLVGILLNVPFRPPRERIRAIETVWPGVRTHLDKLEQISFSPSPSLFHSFPTVNISHEIRIWNNIVLSRYFVEICFTFVSKDFFHRTSFVSLIQFHCVILSLINNSFFRK